MDAALRFGDGLEGSQGPEAAASRGGSEEASMKRETHYFSYRVNRGKKGCTTYGVCGASSGRFTTKHEEVTCPPCDEVLTQVERRES